MSTATTPPHPVLLQARAAYAAAQTDLYRACTLCDFGSAGQCQRTGKARSVEAERARGGACGPEALHMRYRGSDLQA